MNVTRIDPGSQIHGDTSPRSGVVRAVDAVRQLLNRGTIDGRMVLLTSVAAYLSVVAIARLWLHLDVWRFLGVPSGPSAFFDARNLTAALDCHRLGIDPLYTNPCDPWGRPLMYLRPWLLLGYLGLTQTHTVAIAVVLIAAMFLLFAAISGPTPAGTGVLLALAACSPAVMFAVERANMDVALFSVVAIALLLWRDGSRWPASLSPVLVLIAAMAKLYPIFALPAFVLAGRRRAAWVAIASGIVFVLYVALTFGDVRHAAQIATQGEEYSYGSRILIAHLYHQTGVDRWNAPAAVKQAVAAVPVAAAMIAIVVLVRRRFVALTTTMDATLLAFYVGALIYLGTFVTTNNFDYRLVFLLLTLPQLTAWCRRPPDQLSSLATATLLTVLLALWVGSLSRLLHLWDELVSWLLAGLMSAVLVATFPALVRVWRTLIHPDLRRT
jgi:hypothetical protein